MALVLVLVLPSRPAMAVCFGELGARVDTAPSTGGEEREDDGCCPSKRAASEEKEPSRGESQHEPHESGCPCHGECPPGCTMACGFAAVVLSMQLELGPVTRVRVVDAEPVAAPPDGVGPEILHVPR